MHRLLSLLVITMLAGCGMLPSTTPTPSPAPTSPPSPAFPSTYLSTVTPSPVPALLPTPLPDGSFRLSTGDGLSLTLSADGQVSGLEIDGVQLVTGSAPALWVRDMSRAADPPVPNLLSNPGFEGEAGWETLMARDAEVAFASDQARSGSRALAVAATGQGMGAVIADPVPVIPGHRYRVSAHFLSRKGYISHPSGSAVFWQRDLYRYPYRATGLYLWWVDAAGQRIGEEPELAAALHWHAQVWRRLNREVNAPEGAAAVQVVVAARPDEGDTVWVDDVALIESPEADRPLTGEVTLRGETLVQRTNLPEAGLAFTVTYTARSGYIAVHTQVADTTGQERALEVAWGAPVSAQGWHWWDSIRESRPITTPMRYFNAVSADFSTWMPMSLYPVAVVEDGARGLALALPLDQPRVALLSYDGGAGRLEGRAFLGTSPQAIHLAPRADFTLNLYRTDPAWGLRSALARLEEFYPEWFDSCLNPDDYAGFEQGDFASQSGAQAVARYDAEGVYTAHYTCADMPVKMDSADGPPPTLDGGWERVAAYAAGDNPLHRARARAFQVGVAYDADGEPILKHVGVFPWAPDVWEIAWVGNLDPDLPEGYGQYLLTEEVDRAFTQATAVGAQLDGVFMDNFMATPTVDLRPEHIAVADLPLTYSFNDYRPGVHTMSSLAEYLAALRAYLDSHHGADKGISINFWGLATVNFLAPWIDGFGGEGEVQKKPTNWNPAILDYRRAIADHRLQLFSIQEPGLSVADVEAAGERALFYGILLRRGPHGTGWEAGAEEALERYTALVRAYNGRGWEPVTYAHTDHPDVAVERFGSDVFTVHNWGDAPATYTLQVDLAALDLGAPSGVSELTTGEAVSFTIEGGDLLIQDTLESGQTHVFRVLRPEGSHEKPGGQYAEGSSPHHRRTA